MELQGRLDQCFPKRKGQKRMLNNEIDEEQRQISVLPTGDAHDALLSDVNDQASILNSAFSGKAYNFDRAGTKCPTHVLANLVKNK